MPTYRVTITRSKTIWEVANLDVEAEDEEIAATAASNQGPDNVEWFEDSTPDYDDYQYDVEAREVP